MAFETIIGNEKNKQFLSKTVENNEALHSYMFIGEDGIGKTLFAKEFAKMLLCHETQNKPCGKCKSCIEFESENHPDFLHIVPEDGKTIKIEQIRYLQEKIAEKPVTSSKKVYIIENSECMTREASNSLLKTLEEPPSYATIILTTANESKLLATIQSRCMKIHFMPIPEEQILLYLKKQGLDENITPNMQKQWEGSIGKALKSVEEYEKYVAIENLIKEIPNTNIANLWTQAEVLYSAKEDIINLLSYMNTVFSTLMKKEKNICYTKAIETIEETKQKILANANYDMSIDYLLLKLWEELV